MNVVVDMPVHESLLEALRTIRGFSVQLVEAPEERSRRLPADLLRNCDVLFCTFLPENLDDLCSLKFVQISSAGYTQLVGKGLPQRSVRAANALGVFDVPIAEWNLAMMINLARDLRGMVQNQQTAHWERSARFQNEIHGSTVGIWGYGGIGRETARLAKAFGMRVHVLTRNGVSPRHNTYYVPGTGDPEASLPDRVFLPDEKAEFLECLDFLVLAMPQTAATTGIVGSDELRQMKRSAFLLNPARGPLVEESALLDALRSGQIAGAALDTHYHYPLPSEHPLWSMPNVMLTPHISGSSLSPRFLERTWDIFVQNVTRLLSGAPLLNELSPRKLNGQ